MGKHLLLRPAFTLIEVLISIALLGIILPVLYSSVDVLQDSNRHLFHYLEKAKKQTQATDMFYLDIASSNGDLEIKKEEFAHLCINQTKNSLYGLSYPKVCWVVLKEKHQLVRVEGVDFHLPLRMDEKVWVDPVMSDVELFDLYWEEGRVLVLVKKKGSLATTFMVQGITKPLLPQKKKKKVTSDTNVSATL